MFNNNLVHLQEYAAIKMQSDVVHGPLHLFNEIKNIRENCRENLQLLLTSVQRNGFFAHPHCVLVAMLGKSITMGYYYYYY